MVTGDLRAQVEAAIDQHVWNEFAGTGEVLTIVMRDDAVNAAMTVFNERLEHMENNARGRCRWCYVPTSEALAYQRNFRKHRMTCRFYVGSVEHRRIHSSWSVNGAVWFECSCGTSWLEREHDGCPNAAETWRGLAEGGSDV